MSTSYETLLARLSTTRQTWLVTGAAGFIGSHLTETLLALNQDVVGLDNFSTGRRSNLQDVRERIGAAHYRNLRLLESDIRDPRACREACQGVDVVLHQAALGSVPRSIADPLTTNAVNIDGFLNMLVGARDAGVRRFVYAASSSTYGDHPDLPKLEERTGKPLSPYAVTKLVNELYAEVFSRSYGVATIGLRYFNVFGPRQDPNGPYAAVIPRWIDAMCRDDPITIFGDGETSRDFSYVRNVVQANLLAACTDNPAAVNQVYNIALGRRTTLKQLYFLIRGALATRGIHYDRAPEYKDFRAGDVRHSQASIDKATGLLGYVPSHSISVGMGEMLDHLLQLSSGPLEEEDDRLSAFSALHGKAAPPEPPSTQAQA